MRVAGPEGVGQGEVARVGAFEFVQRLSGVAEDHELDFVAAGCCVDQVFEGLVDELEKEGRHVLAFVEDDDVVAGDGVAGGEIGGQEMSDACIDGGFVGVVLDGETVKRVDVEVGQFERGDLVFDFQTQHFVVRKLQNAQMRKRLGQRQNGGGFARSGAGFHDDVAASTDMVQHRLLFITGFVHVGWMDFLSLLF